MKVLMGCLIICGLIPLKSFSAEKRGVLRLVKTTATTEVEPQIANTFEIQSASVIVDYKENTVNVRLKIKHYDDALNVDIPVNGASNRFADALALKEFVEKGGTLDCHERSGRQCTGLTLR